MMHVHTVTHRREVITRDTHDNNDKRCQRCWHVTRLIMVGGLWMLLGGCTGVNPDFGCDASAGSHCTPVARVNAQAEAGYFDDHLLFHPLSTSSSHKRVSAKKNKHNKQGDLVSNNAKQAVHHTTYHQQRAVREQAKRAAGFTQFRVSAADIPTTSKAHASFPARTSERIQRVWIAPYEDSDHRYHAASEVFVVLAPPRWASSSASLSPEHK